jgi:hypothetical protein
MGDPEHLCPVLWIKIGEPSRMYSRQDEHVPGLYRLDVHDRDGAFVLVNQAHLIISGDQPAEQTVCGQVHRIELRWKHTAALATRRA